MKNFSTPRYKWLAQQTSSDLVQLRVELEVAWETYKALSLKLDEYYNAPIKAARARLEKEQKDPNDMPWD